MGGNSECLNQDELASGAGWERRTWGACVDRHFPGQDRDTVGEAGGCISRLLWGHETDMCPAGLAALGLRLGIGSPSCRPASQPALISS